MNEIKESPFLCHVFVCTNDRKGERKSCADGQSPEVRAALKQTVKDRGWRGRVRVSGSGCLGLCEQGPNVIFYPQKTWFSAASPDDVEAIVKELQSIVESES